ncbi:MAG: hypothetical protein U1F43_37260 [Myxococcota bacterium]
MRTHPALVIAASLLVAAEIACDTVAGGKNDVLAFEFDADTALFPSAFSTPLAQGTRVGVHVWKSESDKTAVSVVNAESGNPSVANITSTAGNLITIEALSVGTAEITVTTADGDDAFDVTVAALGKVDLEYPGAIVSDSPKSAGVVGGTARFLMSLKDADNKVLIGYGDVPVAISPTGAATLGTSDDVGFLGIRFETPGTLEITGQGDDKLTMTVVAAADLTALTWKGFAEVPTLPVGGQTVGILRGATAGGDKVVGVASLATVTTGDDAVCSITANPRLGEGVFTLSAKKAGECQVTASLGALAGRATITVQ